MTNKYKELKVRVLELIPRGKDNRKPMSYFIEETGLKRRDITQILNELRRDYPICTDRQSPGGYWLGNEQDIINTIVMLKKTSRTIETSIDYLLKHLDGMEMEEEW